jgi:hypothetical protein
MNFTWIDETKEVTNAYRGGTGREPSTSDSEASSGNATGFGSVILAPSAITQSMSPALRQALLGDVSGSHADQASPPGVIWFECSAGGGTIVVSSRDAEKFCLGQYQSPDATLTATAELVFPKGPSRRLNADALAGTIMWQLGPRLGEAAFCFTNPETDHKLCRESIVYAMEQLTRMVDGDMAGQQS